VKKIFTITLIFNTLLSFAGTITSNVTSLPSFLNCVINFSAVPQKFIISGTGLTNSVILTPSTHFEVSLNCKDQFSSRPLNISNVSGSLATSTIYVRFMPSALGALTGNVQISSVGSNTVSVLLSGVGTNYTIPTTSGGYYNSTNSLNGAALKTALYNKILGHSVTSYGSGSSGLWATYSTTDPYYNGKVWDIYSTGICTVSPYEFTFSADQCGGYTNEGDCYNREHSFPQSWFNSSTPMVSDMYHVYPTDGKVNGLRSNYPYGEVSSPSSNSLLGGKLGPNTTSGYTGTAFEPIDEYKGDLARTYFYMATRYENLIASWQSNGNADDILNGTAHPAFDSWTVNLLIKWHNQDPISSKELNRNNAIFGYQGNRNPYIDSPQFVQRIWGGASPAKPTIAASNVSVDLETISPLTFNLKWKSGNGNRRIILVKANSPVNAIPTDSIEYLANSDFGSGTQLGSGNYVIYKGMGSNVIVKNCTLGTTYYFAIYEFNGTNKTAQYYTVAATAGTFNYLPVKLVLFEAQFISKNLVNLKWTTASEINNDKFEIEKLSEDNIWEKVGEMKGNGNTNQLSNYSYIDSLPLTFQQMQSINYRLKQIDFDSNFEYSKTVTVSNEYYGIENMENVEWSLLPNPITNQFQIDAYFSSNNSLKITIKDLLGNDVYQTTKQVSNGNQIINIDNLDKLHAGCYILQIQYGSVYKQKLIMKQ
jgi:endonuclease I